MAAGYFYPQFTNGPSLAFSAHPTRTKVQTNQQLGTKLSGVSLLVVNVDLADKTVNSLLTLPTVIFAGTGSAV